MYNCIINIKKKFDISYFDIGKHRFFFCIQIVRSVYTDKYVRKIAAVIAESL